MHIYHQNIIWVYSKVLTKDKQKLPFFKMNDKNDLFKELYNHVCYD